MILRGGQPESRRGVYAAPAVEKAFAVLECISLADRGLRMVDVVKQLQMPKSSAFVMLSSLERLGYLLRDPTGRYRLTLRMYELGTRALRAMSDSDVVDLAEPELERLRDLTGLTVHLARRDGASVVYLLKLEGRGLVRFDTYVGKRAALHLTGVGKALAANLTEDVLNSVATDLDFTQGTSKAAKSMEAFTCELEKVREQGYAVEEEEEVAGVVCVAAPICNRLGEVSVAVGVVGLAHHLVGDTQAEVAVAVTNTARAISELLG